MNTQTSSDVVTAAMPDGEIILLHGGTRQYFSLNETASFVWRLLEAATPAERIREALIESYDITGEAAGDALNELMRELEAWRLICCAETRAS
jgi:hypothetical protein